MKWEDGYDYDNYDQQETWEHEETIKIIVLEFKVTQALQ